MYNRDDLIRKSAGHPARSEGPALTMPGEEMPEGTCLQFIGDQLEHSLHMTEELDLVLVKIEEHLFGAPPVQAAPIQPATSRTRVPVHSANSKDPRQ